MVAIVMATLIYVVAHYCLSVPLSRFSQQGDSESGMMTTKVPGAETAEVQDNREGNQAIKTTLKKTVAVYIYTTLWFLIYILYIYI